MAASLGGALCAPRAASASDVQLVSTTLAWTRPEWRAGDSRQQAALIQRLRLTGRDFDTPLADDLGFELSAWGQAGFGGVDGGAPGAADVEIANVRALLLKKRLKLTLGRQVVVGGVARFTHLDGGRVDADVWGGLTATVYGGLNVVPRFMEGKGDAVVGSRVSWRRSWESELGASIIQVLDHGVPSRRDVGVDARWAIRSNLFLDGALIWSLLESRLADGQLAAHLSLSRSVQLSADVRRTAPDLYLPRSSIFSVFAEEERDSLGGSVTWQATSEVAVAADYHALSIVGQGGHDLAARVDWRPGRATSVGAQARWMEAPVNGYVQARAFARQGLWRGLVMVADVDGTWLTRPVNGERLALLASATATYPIASGWSAHLSGLVGTTPLYRTYFEVIARASYDFTWDGGTR
jgi:hypothetical protein